MNRLPRCALDPAFDLFLLRLSADTAVNEFRFVAWLRRNQMDLAFRFHRSDEDKDTPFVVENVFGIWARGEFLAETRA